MAAHADDRRWDRTERPEPAEIATVESYEVDDGVVFYDAENPLAWVEATQTVTLRDRA